MSGKEIVEDIALSIAPMVGCVVRDGGYEGSQGRQQRAAVICVCNICLEKTLILIFFFYYFGVQSEELINIKSEVKEEEMETYVGGDLQFTEEVGMIMNSEQDGILQLNTGKQQTL